MRLNNFFSSGAQIEVRVVVDDLVGHGLAVVVAQDCDAGHLVQGLGMDLLRLCRFFMKLKQIYELLKQRSKCSSKGLADARKLKKHGRKRLIIWVV